MKQKSKTLRVKSKSKRRKTKGGGAIISTLKISNQDYIDFSTYYNMILVLLETPGNYYRIEELAEVLFNSPLKDIKAETLEKLYNTIIVYKNDRNRRVRENEDKKYENDLKLQKKFFSYANIINNSTYTEEEKYNTFRILDEIFNNTNSVFIGYTIGMYFYYLGDYRESLKVLEYTSMLRMKLIDYECDKNLKEKIEELIIGIGTIVEEMDRLEREKNTRDYVKRSIEIEKRRKKKEENIRILAQNRQVQWENDQKKAILERERRNQIIEENERNSRVSKENALKEKFERDTRRRERVEREREERERDARARARARAEREREEREREERERDARAEREREERDARAEREEREREEQDREEQDREEQERVNAERQRTEEYNNLVREKIQSAYYAAMEARGNRYGKEIRMEDDSWKCYYLLKENGITADPKSFKMWYIKNHPDKGGDMELIKTMNDCRDMFFGPNAIHNFSEFSEEAAMSTKKKLRSKSKRRKKSKNNRK